MARIVTLKIDTGPIRTGGWCEKCQLPSLIEVDMLLLKSDGVSVLGHVKRCTEGPHEAG